MASVETFLGQRLEEYLEEVASDKPAPGGGSVAAVVVALAAGLAGMAARFSLGRWDEAEAVAERADALRRRIAPLAPADSEAYGEVLRAFRLPRDGEPDARDRAIREALEHAAEVPLELAQAAAEVAALGALAAERGNPNLRGDAAAAATFAAAGARVAASLVAINLGTAEPDERIERARGHADAARAAADRAAAVGA